MRHRAIDSSFGQALDGLLQRGKHLTREQLAIGIGQDAAVITDMCKGRRLSGRRARERVLAIVGWLHQQRLLLSLDEADALLATAGMAELSLSDADEATLFYLLDDPDRALPRAETPPFSCGRAITHPARFFGRSREVVRLFDLWRYSPQNAIVLGPRWSGKTSLLSFVQRVAGAAPDQLRPDQRSDLVLPGNDFSWVYVDFRNPNMGRRSYLLRYVLRRMGLPAPAECSLDQFVEIVSTQLRWPTVLLLDEVGLAAEGYPELDQQFWSGLHALGSSPARHFLAIVLALADDGRGNAGYNVGYYQLTGYVTSLGPLDEAEAYALIASSPIPFRAEEADWIVETSGCWPLLLQILCDEHLSSLRHDERAEPAWRESGVQRIAPYLALLNAQRAVGDDATAVGATHGRGS